MKLTDAERHIGHTFFYGRGGAVVEFRVKSVVPSRYNKNREPEQHEASQFIGEDGERYEISAIRPSFAAAYDEAETQLKSEISFANGQVEEYTTALCDAKKRLADLHELKARRAVAT